MAGAWDAMLLHEQRANDPAWAFDEWKVRTPQRHYAYGPVPRTAFAAGIRWVLRQQLTWETLPAREAIRELRKGPESIFYPLFQDDPRIWAECPGDGRTVIGVEGYCDTCGFDFDK